MTWPDSYYVTYDWGLGELESISENGSTTLASFAYDELGRRSSLTRGNGVETRYGFDNRSMLEEFTVDLDDTAYDESWTPAFAGAGSSPTTRPDRLSAAPP